MPSVKSLLIGNELVNHFSPISSRVIHDTKTSSTTLGPEGKLETDLCLKRREFIAGTWYKVLERARGLKGSWWLYPELSNSRKRCCSQGWRSRRCWIWELLAQVAAATAAVRLATQHPGRTRDWLPLLLGHLTPPLLIPPCLLGMFACSQMF